MPLAEAAQSCPWVGLTHGLGWVVGREFLFFWIWNGRLSRLSSEKVESVELIRWRLRAGLIIMTVSEWVSEWVRIFQRRTKTESHYAPQCHLNKNACIAIGDRVQWLWLWWCWLWWWCALAHLFTPGRSLLGWVWVDEMDPRPRTTLKPRNPGWKHSSWPFNC